jgi:hypothetical protein
MKSWYYVDSWSWASTWGGGAAHPVRTYQDMQQFDQYSILNVTTALDTSLPHNTNRSFLWSGSSWTVDHIWPGDMPRDATALPGPDQTPPKPMPWWLIILPAAAAAIIVYDVVGPRRWR